MCADNDEPGLAHAWHVHDELTAAGCNVAVYLPTEGKDAAESITAGQHWADWPEADRTPDPDPVLLDDDAGNDLRVLTLADVAPERVRWAWQARLPLGKVVVLDGDPGAGKSTLAVDVAARITTGTPMPDGDRSLPGPADVIYLTAEDGLGDTLRPRLDAAGGDPGRFHVLDAVAETDDDGGKRWRPPSIPRDCHHLACLIERTGAALVVVDVLAAYLDVRDGHADGDVRRALHPLAALAARTGVCVVVIRHLRKSRGSAIYAGGGSIGVIGAARVGLLAAADPNDDNGARRVLAVTKCNIDAQAPSLAYRLVPAAEHGCARLAWDGPTAHRADDLLAVPDPPDADAHDAAGVLAAILTDGPLPAKEALAQMTEAGFSEDQTKRAKKKLQVTSQKLGAPGQPGAEWRWHLPPDDHEGSEGSEGSTDNNPTPFHPFDHPDTP